MRNSTPSSPSTVRAGAMMTAVAAIHRVTMSDMLSQLRYKQVVMAREAFVGVVRDEGGDSLSYPDLGKMLRKTNSSAWDMYRRWLARPQNERDEVRQMVEQIISASGGTATASAPSGKGDIAVSRRIADIVRAIRQHDEKKGAVCPLPKNLVAGAAGGSLFINDDTGKMVGIDSDTAAQLCIGSLVCMCNIAPMMWPIGQWEHNGGEWWYRREGDDDWTRVGGTWADALFAIAASMGYPDC